VSHGEPGRKHGAEEVDPYHALQYRRVGLGERGAQRDAGGADQHIKPAEMFHGSGDGMAALFAVRHVGGHSESFGAEAICLPDDLVQRGHVTCGDDDAAAMSGQTERRGATDAG
jgi:hypothetical protein